MLITIFNKRCNMYEHKKQPLAPKEIFYKRVLSNFVYTSVLLGLCLLIGVFGYHFAAEKSWIDSLLNASMILSGMGPVGDIGPDIGKYFASFYALFSGVAFITSMGILITPIAHRFFHKLHLEE